MVKNYVEIIKARNYFPTFRKGEGKADYSGRDDVKVVASYEATVSNAVKNEVKNLCVKINSGEISEENLDGILDNLLGGVKC